MAQARSPLRTLFALLLPLLTGLALLALWVKIHEHWPLIFPSPQETKAALLDEYHKGNLARDAKASLLRVGLGFGLGVVLGIPGGLCLGHLRWTREAFMPALNFFRCLSPIVWIPFALTWFGLGDKPVIFIIFIATVFPLALATMAAVAGIPTVYFRVAHDYGLRGVRLLTNVTLPAILPQLITALRVTAGLAWLVMVAAEMISGNSGLGFTIWDARNGMMMDLMVATMLVIGAIGITIDRMLALLTRLPVVRWGYEN